MSPATQPLMEQGDVCTPCIDPPKGGTTGHCHTGPVSPASRSASEAGPSSSLDPLESGSQAVESLELPSTWFGNPEFDLCPATAEETRFRHSGWAVRRRQVWDSLVRVHVGQHRLQAFKYCGACLWVQKATAGDDVRLVANHCHDRFCIPCQTSRAARISAQVEDIIRERAPRFVTLTLRCSPTSLRDQLDRLYRSFAALRRRRWWLSKVRGGAAFVEVKLGERSGQWHPHLHLLIDSDFLPQRELSQEWHAVTGDSSIVDVRAIPDPAARARYVTKYVTKPADSSVFAVPDRLDEFVLAMRGRRLLFTFGEWLSIRLNPDADAGGEWENVGGVASLQSRASDGDPEAARWLQAVARKYPGFAAAFGLDYAAAGPAP